MPRTAKNPDTYINRNGLVTRQISTSTVLIEYVDVENKKFDDMKVTVMKNGNSAITEARKQFKNLMDGKSVQIVNTKIVEVATDLYGMPDEEFVKYGRKLKPNTDNEPDTNTETEEQ